MPVAFGDADAGRVPVPLDLRLHLLGEEQPRRVTVAGGRAEKRVRAHRAAPVREVQSRKKQESAARFLDLRHIGAELLQLCHLVFGEWHGDHLKTSRRP